MIDTCVEYGNHFALIVLPDSMVKLKNGEIKWIVKHVENRNIVTRQVAEIYGVTIKEGAIIS